MNKEKIFFIVWCIKKKNYFSVLYFFIQKIMQRLFLKYKYGQTYYPESIKKLIENNSHMEKFQWIFKGDTNEKQKDMSGISITSIKLAGMNLSIENNQIPWEHDFDDPEDSESLHRWNWILYLLSEKKYSEEQLAVWFSFQAEEWITHFHMELENKKTASLDRWESYTVGERISNCVLFFYLTNNRPSDNIIHTLYLQTHYLIYHMEYKGENTGNHVLNNARAIYIAGVFLNIHKWCEIAKEIMFREVPKMVTEDGFMREGSSHYHFLFTRWFLEVNNFAYKAEDDQLIKYLLPWLKCLLIKCYFFLVFDTEQKKWQIPLFGDISPDFIPSWLIDIPWSKPAQKIQEPGYRNIVSINHNEGKWSELWGNIKNKNHAVFPDYNETKILEYKNSGWFRCDYGKYTLFLRGDKKNIPGYVGHFHQDFYHFCLFYKGMEIFIDSGRKTYNTDEWGNFGMSPEAHNSVLIDGFGSVPFRPHRYPVQYSRADNHIEIINQKEDNFQINIESDSFQRLIPVVDFSRKIILDKKKILVEDFFQGKKDRDIKTFFHWAPGTIIIPINRKSWEIKIKNYGFVFSVVCEKTVHVEVLSDKDSPLGSASRMYGHAEETPVIIVKTVSELPLKIVYSLYERKSHSKFEKEVKEK